MRILSQHPGQMCTYQNKSPNYICAVSQAGFRKTGLLSPSELVQNRTAQQIWTRNCQSAEKPGSHAPVG